MKKIKFKQRLQILFGVVLSCILICISLLVYSYLRNAEKVIHLEISTRLEQSVTSLSFHALNYADGERTAIVDINSDINDFEEYFNFLGKGGEVIFRNEKTVISPFDDSKSKEILLQLEAEWTGYKENLQKITDSKADRIDTNAQKYIVNNVGKLKNVIKNLSEHYYGLIQADDTNYLFYLLTFSAVLIVFLFFENYRISNFIISPLAEVATRTQRIAKGELLIDDDLKQEGNEIEVVLHGLNQITIGLDKITAFADKVGDGDFSASLEIRSEKDLLSQSLLEMRDNLFKVSQEEQKRKWANEGLAKFASILRLDRIQDSEQFGNTVIVELVKYVNANQGGLFIHHPDLDRLQLIASYAYERKRFINREVPTNDGLIGQAFMEKEMIYLKEIPDGYVYITSGLGEATPSNLLLVPLKINDTVFGVIELCSFEIFEPYQLEFLEKVSESIAATIATFRNTAKTAKLLRESQEQSEMLRAQEEEMRQNVEELMATQEQMKRKQEEAEIANRKLQANEQILKKTMEKTKLQSEELNQTNRELAQKQEEMRQQMLELEQTRLEVELIKAEEQKRTKALIDQQKKLMAKVMEDFKKKENNLKEQLAILKNEKTKGEI
jgi:hypothetical protein